MINIITPEIYCTNAKGEILMIFKNKNLGSGKIIQHITNVMHFVTSRKYSQSTMMNRSYKLVGAQIF